MFCITFLANSFSKNPYHIKKWNDSFVPVYSSLETSLPKNIHLLSMETIIKEDNQSGSSGEEAAKIILRLENFYEKYELDEVTEINLDKLFKSFSITSLVEMNLAANQEVAKKTMMEWMVESKDGKNAQRIKRSPSSGSGKADNLERISLDEIAIDKRSSAANNESRTIGNSIRLKPMEIRTFVITVKHKEPQADPGKTPSSSTRRRTETPDRYVDKNGYVVF